MSRGRRGAVAGLVLAGSLAGFGGRGSAAELVETAWWWRVQTGDLPVPAPPGVDADDLLVQGGPDGAIAIAALRITVASTETLPVLTIHLADASQGAADAVVLACPTNSFWRAGGNQPWADKPVPADTCPAAGTLAADGKTMTFDLSTFTRSTVLQVVLVPGRVEGRPAGADGSVFSLTLDAPQAGDLATSPASPTSAPTTAPVSPTTAPAGGVQYGTGGTSVPAFRPSAGLVPAAPAPVVTPAPAAQAAAQPASVEPTIPIGSEEGNTARGLGIALLVAATVGAVAASRREVLLGYLTGREQAVEAATVGGIGRFAQPREGAPPSLL